MPKKTTHKKITRRTSAHKVTAHNDMINQSTVFNSIKIIILGLLFSAAVTYAQTTWQTPPHAANTYFPINVGTGSQNKNGGLTLGALTTPNTPSLAVFGTTQFNKSVNASFGNGFFYVSGKVGVGVAPTEKLDVNGGARLRSGSGTGPYLCVRTNGLLIRNGPSGSCY